MFSALPAELVQQVLLYVNTSDLATFAQTAHIYRDVVYDNDDHFIWRSHFITTPFDNPRKCLTPSGKPVYVDGYDWMGELQRRFRARTVVMKPDVARPGEHHIVLITLVDLVVNIPPATSAYEEYEVSRNLIWLGGTPGLGEYITQLERDSDAGKLTAEEQQLVSRLHTFYGLTDEDVEETRVIDSRAFVYDMRKYSARSGYGPFFSFSTDLSSSPTSPNGSGTGSAHSGIPAQSPADVLIRRNVNWAHIRAIQHVISMHAAVRTNMDGTLRVMDVSPMSLPFCQAQLANNGPSVPDDWAGVLGPWRCVFCFVDHRDLIAFNLPDIPDDQPRDRSIFAQSEFIEVFRYIDIEMHVESTVHDPLHPTRPRVNFSGDIGGQTSMIGQVFMTADNNVCWHFTSGEGNNMIWSSVGIQIGAVQSGFGVLGSWTTVFHEDHDPVGPFWLHKLYEGSVDLINDDSDDDD